MKIKDHFNKKNLHHAYLIEGDKKKILPEILDFLQEMGITTLGNPDFYNINLDSFKIEDAYNLKSLNNEKSFTTTKRIFLISANNFLLEAQNTLLKIFEEPTPHTHFFIILPNSDVLLKTLISRFYLIKTENNLAEKISEAKNFIQMSLRERLDFIKSLLNEVENEDAENIFSESSRAKAVKFLDTLEMILSQKLENKSLKTNCFQHFFKVREFLRQPGSSVKTLMESVAIVAPNLI